MRRQLVVAFAMHFYITLTVAAAGAGAAAAAAAGTAPGGPTISWDKLVAWDERIEHTTPTCKRMVQAKDDCAGADTAALSKKTCFDKGCCWRVKNLAVGLPICYFPTNYGHVAAKRTHVLHLIVAAAALILACVCCACRHQFGSLVEFICPYHLQLARYQSLDPLRQKRQRALASGGSGSGAAEQQHQQYQLVGGPARVDSAATSDGGGGSGGASAVAPTAYQYAMSAAQPPEDTGQCI